MKIFELPAEFASVPARGVIKPGPFGSLTLHYEEYRETQRWWQRTSKLKWMERYFCGFYPRVRQENETIESYTYSTLAAMRDLVYERELEAQRLAEFLTQA